MISIRWYRFKEPPSSKNRLFGKHRNRIFIKERCRKISSFTIFEKRSSFKRLSKSTLNQSSTHFLGEKWFVQLRVSQNKQSQSNFITLISFYSFFLLSQQSVISKCSFEEKQKLKIEHQSPMRNIKQEIGDFLASFNKYLRQRWRYWAENCVIVFPFYHQYLLQISVRLNFPVLRSNFGADA